MTLNPIRRAPTKRFGTSNPTIVVGQSAYQVPSDSTGVTEAVDTGAP
jgi:hypothetical protein